MPRRKAPEDMSVEELRRLLIEKRRGVRHERLEHFKRTGRVVDIAPDAFSASAPVVDTLEDIGDQPQVTGTTRRRVMNSSVKRVMSDGARPVRFATVARSGAIARAASSASSSPDVCCAT